MKTRWLAGFALFALGFACAQVIKVSPAGAGDGMLDEGLQFIEHPDRFELINTGLYRYLLVVQPKAGTPATIPDIIAATGTVSINKQGVEGVTAIRLQPLGKISPGDLQDWGCNPGIEDCVGPEPILPPRPPKYEIELGPTSFTDPDAYRRP